MRKTIFVIFITVLSCIFAQEYREIDWDITGDFPQGERETRSR